MPQSADLNKNMNENQTRILLVDDNSAFLDVAARFLRRYSELLVVGACRSAEEVYARAQAAQPHVILLDLNLAGQSGLEVIPFLRSALPAARIIVLTLYDSNGYRRASQAAGADAFVAKSTMISDLLPAIRRVVEREM
jgi:DNA-binding NarL/FixJ family response regulator